MSEPNWQLVAADPERFFELPGDFERKDLKRAYNRLIKVYKPERSPNEFQKIRAAYELLDQQLRYGRKLIIEKEAAQYQWRGTSTDAGAGVELHERLRTESPVAVYKELQAKRDKEPGDFFALAVMADALTSDPLLFFQWLLTGLKFHPSDQGLLTLLKRYFASEIEASNIPKMLLATSKVINSELFYFVTETCWMNWSREAGFRDFKSLLAKCESNLKIFSGRGRSAFLLQVLRRVIWNADEAWLQNVFGFLNTELGKEHYAFDDQLHFLENVLEYKKVAASVVKTDPTRKRIHDTILDFFRLEDSEADRVVIETQLEFAGDAESLLAAFPASIGDSQVDSLTSMWVVWNSISDEVMDRNGIRPRQSKQENFLNRLFRLMEDLDAMWQISTSQILTYYALMTGPYLFCITLPYWVFGSWVFDPSMFFLVAIPMVLIALPLYHFWFRSKVVEPMFGKIIQRSIRKMYLALWRGRFVQLLEASQASMLDLTYGLQEVVMNNNSELRASTFLLDFVPGDFGIAFYSLAVRFRA